MPRDRDEVDREINRLFKDMDRKTAEELSGSKSREITQEEFTRGLRELGKEELEKREQDEARQRRAAMMQSLSEREQPSGRVHSSLLDNDTEVMQQLKVELEKLVERNEMLVSIVEDLPDRIAAAFGVET